MLRPANGVVREESVYGWVVSNGSGDPIAPTQKQEDLSAQFQKYVHLNGKLEDAQQRADAAGRQAAFHHANAAGYRKEKEEHQRNAEIASKRAEEGKADIEATQTQLTEVAAKKAALLAKIAERKAAKAAEVAHKRNENEKVPQ